MKCQGTQLSCADECRPFLVPAGQCVSLLLIHGTNDMQVPLPHSQALFGAARGNASLLTIRGADHATMPADATGILRMSERQLGSVECSLQILRATRKGGVPSQPRSRAATSSGARLATRLASRTVRCTPPVTPSYASWRSEIVRGGRAVERGGDASGL